jgi:molecular chaperone HscB
MDPFANLGLSPRFDLDKSELEQRYRQLQREFHPDRHVGAAPAERRTALLRAMEINEAYRILRDDISRAHALLSSLGGGEDEAADPRFLMEIMELREALGEAKAARDAAQVSSLAKRVGEQRADTKAVLSGHFGEALQTGADSDVLKKISAVLAKLKYYQRFLDEVRVIEDVLLT